MGISNILKNNYKRMSTVITETPFQYPNTFIF